MKTDEEARLRERLEATQAELAEARAEARAARAEADVLRSTLETIGSSRSWRLLRPIRQGAMILRSLRQTGSVGAFLWESGKLAADLSLPPRSRDALRGYKRKLARAYGRTPDADLGRLDLDSPRVATGLKRLLRALDDGRPGKVTHLLAVPFLKRGGGDLTAANTLRVITDARGPGSCLLVLTDSPELTVREWLPPGVRVLRLDDYVANASERERLDLLHGLVRAVGPEVFHTVNSVIGWKLVVHRGAELELHSRLFGSIFAFQYAGDGELVGFAADFFQGARPHLAGLLTDNHRFARDLVARYGLDEAWARRIHVVHNACRSLEAAATTPRPAPEKRGDRLRVLWAGRLDAEKLPDVLQEVSRRAEFATFDVWGGTTVDERAPSVVEHERLRLRGSYRDLESVLADGSYDAFLFTSRWEGLPNVLLEVGSHGLPVVAPDVGGIPELVRRDTGYLVHGARNVEGYVEALREIHADPGEAAERARRLAALVRERHSWGRFEQALKSVPGYV